MTSQSHGVLILFLCLVATTSQAECKDQDTLYQPSCYSSLGLVLATSSTAGTIDKLNRYSYARDDAAAFLASDGRIRGAFLEQALRDSGHSRTMEEREFAAAIVAFRTLP